MWFLVVSPRKDGWFLNQQSLYGNEYDTKGTSISSNQVELSTVVLQNKNRIVLG
jgi:hypothetical protein